MSLDLGPFGSVEAKQVLHWIGITWLLALLGRVAWHVQQVKAGNRGFWSIALLWEVPLAMFCGIAGAGAGDYLGLVGVQLAAFISVVAYLGPGGIEAMFLKVVGRYGPGRES